ncbi:DinB family protein [Niabella drilacis]|uniref:DinB superfamily protein n=1 Tax=Niabella drilacis (strain DSM 25811 / CCM 8410 / CCUG 62505 / LMG 26954 / E90) TaxID=1285928 RepID=A0A1G6ITG8_NIADE|nr:DinB family protein [Niabella drilacis]SDC09066.1 DinB superfamily protein [Niabella drilacis]
MRSQPLLDALVLLSEEHTRFAEVLQTLPGASLTQRPPCGGWNVLECMEHLNRYSIFYLREIDAVIQKAASRPAGNFKPGVLGNYFCKIIHPDSSQKAMKTSQPMNTQNARLTPAVLTDFISHQQQFLQLLEKARGINIGKEKTGTSLSRMIRLKLGDTLRFVAYHNERHVRQARNVIAISG